MTYNRFGEFIEPVKPSGLRKDCTCKCHLPGYHVMHCFPCCEDDNEEDGPQVKLGRVFMSEPLRPLEPGEEQEVIYIPAPRAVYPDCPCECHNGVMDVHRWASDSVCCDQHNRTFLDDMYEQYLNKTDDPETKA